VGVRNSARRVIDDQPQRPLTCFVLSGWLQRRSDFLAEPLHQREHVCESLSGPPRCARPSFLHIHPAHSAARHAAMGVLFVLRSLGNHHLGREQQARDGCGILQR
jgi:hypothetical protein